MSLREWNGEAILARAHEAARQGIDATMAACIIHAKANHGAGAHGEQRFVTRTGEAERSVRITQPAKRKGKATEGRWGSKGINYFRRLELGFQGKDSAGRSVRSPAYPALFPAARAEYPKLSDRIKRAFA